MKTLLTPSLIALACFAGFAVAETLLSVQHNSETQQQLIVSPATTAGSNENANVSASQQSQLQAGSSAEQTGQPELTTAVNADNNANNKVQLGTKQNAEPADDMTLPELTLTDSAMLLSNTMAELNTTGLATATVSTAQQISTSATANAANVAQQLSSNVAAHANQTAEVANTIRQQVQDNVNQALQHDASASVAQSVNQAVSAEVSNTVRNSITLATGL